MPGAQRTAALSLAYFLDTVGRPVRLPPQEVTPERIWHGSTRETVELLGLRPREVELLSEFRNDFSPARAETDLASRGIVFIARGEQAYPQALARIYDPPLGLFLYSKASGGGHWQEITGLPRIAIVGARAASRYGVDAAEMLASGLSRAGVCVVSGMARGIDAAAHRGSTGMRGGSIAVLGGGVDVIYPAANRQLYSRLAEKGAIISEYPPGSRPRPWRFPARNRIIAGVSRGVVVVEGREGSGSLITADFCLEQGGEVFAVPGSIFSPLSEGPLKLIRQGALAVAGPDEIIDCLGLAGFEERTDGPEGAASCSSRLEQQLSPAEQALCGAMDGVPRPIDVLAERAGIDSGVAATALVRMELRGLVRYEQGQGYIR